MSRFALIAPCAVALLVLAGCQSEEEKRAEREKLKSELRSELISELNSMVSGEVRTQLQMAIDDHKRKVAHENAVDDVLEAHGLGVSSTEAFEQIATIFNPMVVGRFAEDRGATLELLADRGFSVAETGQIHRVEGGSA